MKNVQTTQQHNTKQQRMQSIYKILLSLPVRVCLPVRIKLWLQPGNTLLNSVTEPVELDLLPQGLRTIETCVTQQHFTLEAALIEYLKQEMRNSEKWHELIEQVHQRYGEQASVKIDVELLGKIRWNGSLLNIS